MGKETGKIFNIERFAYQDGPGVRTVVFLKGCPLHCAWCANPEGQISSSNLKFFRQRCVGCGRCVDVCPANATTIAEDGKSTINRDRCTNCGQCATVCINDARKQVGKSVTVEEVLSEIKKDDLFFRNTGGGVTLSGGEPLSQPEFSYAILKRCDNLLIHTAIETSAWTRGKTLEKMMNVVNLVMVDLKHMDPEIHEAYTGKSNEIILNNIKTLANMSQVNKIVRIPIIPGFNDTEENIEATGDTLSKWGIKNVEILPYHELGVSKYKALGRDYSFNGTSPSLEALQEVKKKLEQYQLSVQLEGLVKSENRNNSK